MKHKLLTIPDSPAFRFVLTMGVVNLFADMTYEGGASINGPFMGSLGASATIIAIVAGVGEFLGYSLRSVSGNIADKTELVTHLAFYSGWPTANSALPIAQRIFDERGV